MCPLAVRGAHADALALLAAACARAPTSRPTDYDAELAAIDRDLAALAEVAFRPPVTLEKAGRTAFLLYRRSSLTSDFADFQATDAAIDQALGTVGPASDLLLLRANLDFRLHRLAKTRESLDRLASLDDGAQIGALRADLELQEGRYEEARRGYEDLVARHQSWDHLARLAYLKSKTGDVPGAETLYVEAEEEISAKQMRAYAWVEMQRGLLDFDGGRPEQALAHYRQAAKAYSGYWLIDEHIAEALGRLSRVDEAIALYRDLVRRTRDPRFVAALADLLAAEDPAAAQALSAEAHRLFVERLALFPEAALGHYLEVLLREDPSSPDLLAQAERNHRYRPNAESKLLLARALLRTNDAAGAKALVEEVLATPWRTPELTKLTEQLRGDGASG